MSATKTNKRGMPMNLGKCMLRECKTCRYETSCFKEYGHEYTKMGKGR